MLNLSSIDTIFLDIDGVVFDEKTLIFQADDAINWFLLQGYNIVFVTNNVNTHRHELINKLNLLMTGHEFQLIDPVDVLKKSIEDSHINARLLYVIGTDVLKTRLRELNLEIIDSRTSQVAPSAILIGSSTQIDYNELAHVVQLINSGTEFWATGRERFFKWKGQLLPSTGAILAFIETATEKRANILGKPSRRIFDLAVGGAKRERFLVVGDDIDIDIAGAQLFGLRNVLVMSGVTSKEKLALSDYKPDLVVNNIYDLVDAFSGRIE